MRCLRTLEEGACAGAKDRRGHDFVLREQVCERLDRRVDRLELLGVEVAQARREPGRPLRLDRAEDLLACGRERQADAALVSLDGRPLDEACLFEAGDELGHAGNRHPLERGQLADPDPGVALDLDEERDLAAGHAQRVDLAPELPVELEEHRAEPVGKDGGIGSNGSGHSLTRLTNRPDPPST